jgi:hypothetical protein
MSAVKQAMTAGGIVTALFTTQFFIASKMTRSVDGEQPIFHVGFVSCNHQTSDSMVTANTILATCLHCIGEELLQEGEDCWGDQEGCLRDEPAIPENLR